MKKLSIILCLLALLIPSATAQDNTEDLLTLLNAVPDTAHARESLITFVDYRSVELARPGTPFVTKFEDVLELPDPFGAIYLAAFRGIASGPDFSRDLFVSGHEWIDVVGFDFIDIDRALTFGHPPEDVNVLMGDFDLDAIATAHTARNYTSKTIGDMTIWCGAVGCDNGSQTDIENRNLANPFGGDLGREKPFIVSETMIVSTAIEQPLIIAEDAITDKLDSIADNPSYRAAVQSIAPDNIVIQGAFVPFTEIILETSTLVTEGDTDAIEALMEEADKLPQYELLMFADTATDEEQVVYVTLVYRDVDSAQTATEVIPNRLEITESTVRELPIQELFTDRGVMDVIANVVEDEENGRALAVFEFRAPLADNEEEDFGLVSSSMVYQMLIQMVYYRDTNWLVAGSGQ